MQLTLTGDLQSFIEEQVASGSYATREDVIRAAVAALRQAKLFGNFAPGELNALIAEGERSLERDGPIDSEQVFDELRRRSAERAQNERR